MDAEVEISTDPTRLDIDLIHRFLAAHAYGNATWRDLLSAIGAESRRSLDRWGREYILRPGMPVIDQAVRVTADGRARLVLRQ